MSDLEQQLTDHLQRRAAAATPRFDLEGIEERGGDHAVVELTPARHRQRPPLWVAVAAALVLVVLIGALVFLDDESTVDVGPATGTSEVPSWPAPVRPPSDEVITLFQGVRDDRPGDAAEEWADIMEAGLTGFALAAEPPPFADLEPGVVISYGVVLDINADGAPDYVAGISSDAPRRGDVRAWLTNLATGETDETVNAPDGDLTMFSLEENMVGSTLLNGSPVPGLDPDTVRTYVWTYATRDGVVFAQDYAPNTGWYAQPAVEYRNAVNPTAEEPVLPAPGEQPTDAVAAEEQVRLAFTGIFDSSSPRETRSHFSERPAVWIAASQQLAEGEYAGFVDDMSAVVDDVVFRDPTHAAVRFRLDLPNSPTPPSVDIGEAVVVDGRWLVSIETSCALLQTVNVQCDMSQ